jgi:hypothetical protein
MAVSEETDGIREFLSEIMYLNLLNGNFFDVISRDFIGPYADHLLIHRRIAEMSSDEQINDFMEQLRNILEHLDEKKYEALRTIIHQSFEKAFPQKSKYEK